MMIRRRHRPAPSGTDPKTWSQDLSLPARDNAEADRLITDLWYAMDCPKSLGDAVNQYVKRPYAWQVEYVRSHA